MKKYTADRFTAGSNALSVERDLAPKRTVSVIEFADITAIRLDSQFEQQRQRSNAITRSQFAVTFAIGSLLSFLTLFL